MLYGVFCGLLSCFLLTCVHAGIRQGEHWIAVFFALTTYVTIRAAIEALLVGP